MTEKFYEIFQWGAAVMMSLIGLAFALLLAGITDWVDNWKKTKRLRNKRSL